MAEAHQQTLLPVVLTRKNANQSTLQDATTTVFTTITRVCLNIYYYRLLSHGGHIESRGAENVSFVSSPPPPSTELVPMYGNWGWVRLVNFERSVIRNLITALPVRRRIQSNTLGVVLSPRSTACTKERHHFPCGHGS